MHWVTKQSVISRTEGLLRLAAAPWCRFCRRRMHHAVNHIGPHWSCEPCHSYARERVTAPPTGPEPYCISCKNKLGWASARGRLRWKCSTCNFDIYQQTLRCTKGERYAPQKLAPCCLDCRKLMSYCCARTVRYPRWICHTCNNSTYVISRLRRRALGPSCIRCKNPMQSDGSSKKRGQRWGCLKCRTFIWATYSKNGGRPIVIQYQGESLSLRQLATKVPIPYATIYERFKKWPYDHFIASLNTHDFRGQANRSGIKPKRSY